MRDVMRRQNYNKIHTLYCEICGRRKKYFCIKGGLLVYKLRFKISDLFVGSWSSKKCIKKQQQYARAYKSGMVAENGRSRQTIALVFYMLATLFQHWRVKPSLKRTKKILHHLKDVWNIVDVFAYLYSRRIKLINI